MFHRSYKKRTASMHTWKEATAASATTPSASSAPRSAPGKNQQTRKRTRHSRMSSSSSIVSPPPPPSRGTTPAANPNEALIIFAQFAAKQWFVIHEEYSRHYTHQQLQQDVHDCMQMLYKFLQHWVLGAFFVPMLIYVQRYVNQVGKLTPIHIFDILFVSTVVTVKFWEDKAINNSTFSSMFSLPTADLNTNELNFLTAIDFDLSISQEESDNFSRSVFESLATA